MDKLVFSNNFLYKTGERIIPRAVSSSVLSEHYSRYIFASNFCQNKKVLNVASGCGYGSEILIKTASEIFNVDISENLIAYGNLRYGNYKNHFLTMDAQNMQFPDKFFDVIVSFETFEHLPNYKQFVSECKRILKDDGVIIFSMPNKNITSPNLENPANRFHFKEWELGELRTELDSFFTINGIYGQNYIKPMVFSDKRVDKVRRRLLYFFYDCIPAIVFKLVKKHYLKYKEVPLEKISIEEKDKIKEASEDDFNSDGHKSAYSIIILVLSKKQVNE